MDGKRVLGVVVELGENANALDQALPGSEEGFTAFFMGEVEQGADPFATTPLPSDAAKTALSSASPIT